MHAVAPERTNRKLYADTNPSEAMGFSEKIALLQKVDAYARGLDPRVKQVSVSMSADWQALQDPNRNVEDPEAGKFTWDGKSAANPLVSGAWTTVAVVPAVEAFNPTKPTDAGRAPFKEITFKDDGFTSDPLRRWSGDTMIDLAKLQALKMTVKDDHLFIEAGGFNEKNPVGWKSPMIVMKRAAK